MAAPESHSPPFLDVLDARQTLRSLQRLPLNSLARLLWHAARARQTQSARYGAPWAHHAAPSAGGLHPITLVISSADSSTVTAYDPISHALCDLEGVADGAVHALHEVIHTIVPEAGDATAITLVANLAKTAAVYSHAESLVWRDAGCVLAVIQLCAVALDLGCCPLGILGGDFVAALPDSAHLAAAGVCVIGEPRARS